MPWRSNGWFWDGEHAHARCWYPQTKLGEALIGLHAKIVASGASLVDEDDIQEEQMTEPSTTLVACVRCGRGVRPAYAVRGMCQECVEAYICELEARRCETCKSWGGWDDMGYGECDKVDLFTRPDFGCTCWQKREA